MKTTIILFLLSVPVWAVLAYVVFLIIKALRKYIRSEPLRLERAEQAKTLGETLKRRRTACKMTQEFVAEALGVSRQAVSKWESGQSDPSTTNLLALAKLFGVRPEELLQVLAPMERLKREQLRPILTQWQALLVSALTSRSGLPPLRPECAQIAEARPVSDITQAIEAIRLALRDLEGNVSPGAICGALTVKLR